MSSDQNPCLGIIFSITNQYFMEFHVRVLLPTPLPSPWSNQNRTSFCPAVYQNHYMYLCNIPCIYLYDICSNYLYTQGILPQFVLCQLGSALWYGWSKINDDLRMLPACYQLTSFHIIHVRLTGIQCFGNPFQKLSSSAGICGSFVHLIHYRCEAFDNKAAILDLFCWCFFTLVSFDSSPLSR